MPHVDCSRRGPGGIASLQNELHMLGDFSMLVDFPVFSSFPSPPGFVVVRVVFLDVLTKRRFFGEKLFRCVTV